jgi:hypothetical protein
VTVSVVLAVEPTKFVSPEYVAVIGYVATARVVKVEQSVAGSIAVQSVFPPDVKATVPVAVPAKPVSASVDAVPNATLDGVALAANEGVACVTVSDVDAVEPR